MQCRNCGTTIADKALICYKCGTATTEAKYQPAPLRASRWSPLKLLIPIIAVLVFLAFAYYYGLIH